MRIAICDDQPDFIEEVISGIKKSGLFRAGWSIKPYLDGIQLLFEYESRANPFDLILMDIDMPLVDGLKAGQAIRARDQAALIVYITNYREYALDAYCARPFDYLLKPIEPSALHRLLSSAGSLLGHRQHRCLIIDGQQQAAVPLHEIIYIECADHLATIHTARQSISCFKPLREIAMELDTFYFCQINRSMLVNLWEVASFDKNNKQVRMKNGATLPVSARKIKPFMAQYLEVLRDGRLAGI